MHLEGKTRTRNAESYPVELRIEILRGILDTDDAAFHHDDEDDLMDEITTACGWCIKSIDYHDMAVVTLSANLQKLKTQTPD